MKLIHRPLQVSERTIKGLGDRLRIENYNESESTKRSSRNSFVSSRKVSDGKMG